MADFYRLTHILSSVMFDMTVNNTLVVDLQTKYDEASNASHQRLTSQKENKMMIVVFEFIRL